MHVVALSRGVLTDTLKVKRSAGLLTGVPCFGGRAAFNASRKPGKHESCVAISRRGLAGAEFEEGTQQWTWRGRRNARDIFIKYVRRFKFWFPERTCHLEHLVCSGPTFPGRHSSLLKMDMHYICDLEWTPPWYFKIYIWHLSRHLFKHLFWRFSHIYSSIYSDIYFEIYLAFSDILSVTCFGNPSDIYHLANTLPFYLVYILAFRLTFLLDMLSDILSGIRFNIYYNLSFLHLTFYLACIAALSSTHILTFYLPLFPAF